MGVFFDTAGARPTTPTVFVHFLQKFHATCELAVFFHLRPLPISSVPVEEHYSVMQCFMNTREKTVPIPNCYRLIVRHGYTDEVITRDLGILVFEQIHNFVIREGGEEAAKTTKILIQGQSNGSCTTESAQHKALDRHSLDQKQVFEKPAELQRVYDSQVVYMVGKEQMRISAGTSLLRRVALSAFLWLRDNTRSKVQALNLAVDKLVEVGFVKGV